MDVPSGANFVRPKESSKEEKIKLARRILKELHSNLATKKENNYTRRILSTAKDTAPIDGPTEPKRMKLSASKSTQTRTDVTSVYFWMAISEQRSKKIDEMKNLHRQYAKEMMQDKLNLLCAIDALTSLLE